VNNTGSFNLEKAAGTGNARAGMLVTGHGAIATPVFMPVASQGTVKAIIPGEITEAGLPMILSNMYHLYLRPGIPVIEKMGGLHRFMGWNGAILTDSGGYQVFSLAKLRRLNDEGVLFRSHIDGSEHFITPELDMKYQESLGADVIMALDQCVSARRAQKKMVEAEQGSTTGGKMPEAPARPGRSISASSRAHVPRTEKTVGGIFIIAGFSRLRYRRA
jgi:queuine tRNA-ribosyltransferase